MSRPARDLKLESWRVSDRVLNAERTAPHLLDAGRFSVFGPEYAERLGVPLAQTRSSGLTWGMRLLYLMTAFAVLAAVVVIGLEIKQQHDYGECMGQRPLTETCGDLN